MLRRYVKHVGLALESLSSSTSRCLFFIRSSPLSASLPCVVDKHSQALSSRASNGGRQRMQQAPGLRKFIVFVASSIAFLAVDKPPSLTCSPLSLPYVHSPLIDALYLCFVRKSKASLSSAVRQCDPRPPFPPSRRRPARSSQLPPLSSSRSSPSLIPFALAACVVVAISRTSLVDLAVSTTASLPALLSLSCSPSFSPSLFRHSQTHSELAFCTALLSVEPHLTSSSSSAPPRLHLINTLK
jgi:hypothetical protein